MRCFDSNNPSRSCDKANGLLPSTYALSTRIELGVVNLWKARTTRGRERGERLCTEAMQPGLESGSPARLGSVSVALADRRAQQTEVDTDGNVWKAMVKIMSKP